MNSLPTFLTRPFNIFTSTRLKLTGWYLIIIMFISICFSIGIYNALTAEFDRIERGQRLRLERRMEQERFLPPEIRAILPQPPEFDQSIITDAKNRIKLTLFLINMGILALSGGAGYFLAGRTLKPIRIMIDEQNRFITDSSHELRTPLTALKTEIEVNLRDKNLKLQEAKDLLKSNLEEVNHLQLLSDNLMRLSNYQSHTHLSVEELSLSKIIEEAEKKVLPLSKQKDILIKNQVKNITLLGSKKSLTEVFVVLLDNAIKYSEYKKTITIRSKISHGMVETTVSDQGYGIADKDIPHLFERFYRADRSRTKSDTPGFGLGLSIAKQIIHQHHGVISLTSTIGKGTTFTIQLPQKLS